jgi:ribose 5-phosphate isomerase B
VSELAKDLISSYLSVEFSTDEDFRRRVEKLRVMDEEG